jgi:V8-like Glu-specific endopeptidase
MNAMRLLAYFLALTLEVYIACSQQTVEAAHPLESMGPRPLDGFEAVEGFSVTSEFRVASTGVGEIILGLPPGRTVPVCTGFLISPSLVLTARHCLQTKDEQTQQLEPLYPESMYLLLDFLDYGTGTRVPLNVTPVERGKGDLDYMLLKTLKPVSLHGRRVPVAGKDPTPKEDLYIYQHPFAQALMISRWNCQATDRPIEGDYFGHYCETEPSSSGAPVLNTDFELVGIHTAGGKSEKDPTKFNVGLLLSRILISSPAIANALREYGSRNGVATGAPPAIKNVYRFTLSNGDVFSLDGGAWSLISAASGTGRIRLEAQSGGEAEYILWDVEHDVLYSIPKAGGDAKRKRAGEVAWTDLGVVTRQ